MIITLHRCILSSRLRYSKSHMARPHGEWSRGAGRGQGGRREGGGEEGGGEGVCQFCEFSRLLVVKVS